MIKRCLAVVVLGLLVGPAVAEPSKTKPSNPPKIEGMFAFNAMKVETAKCAKVTGALLTKLTNNYRCVTPDNAEGSSGVMITATCKAKKAESMYLLFANAKDCNAERETESVAE
jgi:hypothetical protein